MRLLILFFGVLCFVISGCNTCEQIDARGRCTDTGQCNRKILDYGTPLKTEKIEAVETAVLEKIDLIFVWQEIYKLLLELREAHNNKLSEYPVWCDKYTGCDIDNTSWQNYWNELADSSERYLQIKSILVQRLGYLLRQDDRLYPEEENAAVAMVEHLETEARIYSKELIQLMTILNSHQIIISPNQIAKINTALAKFEADAQAAVREHLGNASVGSDAVISQIEQAIRELK